MLLQGCAWVESTSATQLGFGVHHPDGKAQTAPGSHPRLPAPGCGAGVLGCSCPGHCSWAAWKRKPSWWCAGQDGFQILPLQVAKATARGYVCTISCEQPLPSSGSAGRGCSSPENGSCIGMHQSRGWLKWFRGFVSFAAGGLDCSWDIPGGGCPPVWRGQLFRAGTPGTSGVPAMLTPTNQHTHPFQCRFPCTEISTKLTNTTSSLCSFIVYLQWARSRKLCVVLLCVSPFPLLWSPASSPSSSEIFSSSPPLTAPFGLTSSTHFISYPYCEILLFFN